jgi:hypothetical protein
LKLSFKLSAEAVGRALFKQRTITLLEIPADAGQLRPERFAVAARVNSNPDRAGDPPLTPLP